MTPPTDNSVLDLIYILLRGRRTIVRTAALVAGLICLILVLLPRQYSSVGSFLPQSSDDGALSKAASLAAQFGVVLGGTGTGMPADFYSELIQSREFKYGLVDHQYRVTNNPLFGEPVVVEGDLVKMLDLDDESRSQGRDDAFNDLDDLLDINVGLTSGIVSVRATTTDPELSEQMVQATMAAVEDFNKNRRRTQAKNELNFLTQRLAEEQVELRNAEAAVETFLRANRSFDNSPELRFRSDNLRQTVTLHQQLLLALANAWQQSRLDEVRTTPIITIVQSPVVPDLPDRRKLLLKGLLALIFGTFLGCGVAIAWEFFAPSIGEVTPATVRGEVRRAVQELRRPWVLLRPLPDDSRG